MDCKESSATVINQIISILERLDDPTYSKPLEVFNGSSLGQHFRHILDFYNCILKGSEKLVLDYSARERDVLVEQSSEHATNSFLNLYKGITQLSENEIIDVLADFSANDNNDRPIVKSSVGRELMYAYDHAVHHLAIIKIGIRSDFPHISLNQDIGVAPSTIKHRSGNQKSG